MIENNYSGRLKPGQILLLAGPDFLLPFSLTSREGKEVAQESDINEITFMALLREYAAIHDLVSQIVHREEVRVVKTSFYFGTIENNSKTIQSQRLTLPSDLDFGSIETPLLAEACRSWPRDAFLLLGDKIFASPGAVNSNKVTISPLGDSGKVLVRNKSLLVTPDIWSDARNEIKLLISEGYRIGCLPFVNKNRQIYDFEDSHIDGHAALIENNNGQLSFIIANSYINQGNHTKALVCRACESIGANIVEFDDRRLPPLPLNMIQFEDGCIAVTATDQRILETGLMNLVGEDKVFSTRIPLEYIPRFTRGGIRCLTNVIPATYLIPVTSVGI